MKSEELDQQLICYLCGALAEGEQQQLEQLIATDTSVAQHLAELRTMMHSPVVAKRSKLVASQKENVWEAVTDVTTRRHSLRRVVKVAMRIAAVALPFAALSLWVAVGIGDADTYTYTAAAERVSITLPDSTEVILNNNSTLQYTLADGKRQVSLDGMAFFSVKRNEALPFVISAADTEVEVLGTKFSVENIADRQRVRVDVQEGKVAFRAGDKDKRLMARDYATWAKGNMYCGRHSSCQSSWIDGIIEFRAASLVGIAYELMSFYPEIKGVNLEGSNDTTLVTTTFEQQTLEEVISELNIHFNEKITLDNGFLSISH